MALPFWAASTLALSAAIRSVTFGASGSGGWNASLPNAQRYVRRYVTPVPNPLTGEVIHPGYDCIMEIWWNTKEDFDAAMKGLGADPEKLKIRLEDELQLFATNSNPVCTVIESDSPVGPDYIVPKVVMSPS